MIQQDIADIRDHVQDIKKKHSAILSAPQADEKMNQELEQAMAEVQRCANRVKSSLKGWLTKFLIYIENFFVFVIKQLQ